MTSSQSATLGSSSDPQREAGMRILRMLLRDMPRKPAIQLWGGQREMQDATADCTLIVRKPQVLRRLVLERSPLVLADAYFRGDLDIDGDIYSALTLKDHVDRQSAIGWTTKVNLLIDALRLPANEQGPGGPSLPPAGVRRFGHRHTRASDQYAITFHYNVSNRFYGLWLDDEHVYSCAYFHSPDESLDDAQRNKLDHICRKLRLAPGDRLLDIGCGWGALVRWAAKHYGVRAHGITLSQEQSLYARSRIEKEGLKGRASVEIRDYRDLHEGVTYDKVASVGMFEHVGLANLPTYYATVMRVLRPGGLFLNHGITHDEDGWNDTLATRFINSYVFPGGELDRVSNIQLGMERAGFEIHDVEGLRPHYAKTLRHWVQRLESRKSEAIEESGEAIYRIWRLYMAACALEFESGGTGIYQILASRRDQGAWPVPLTRADLYR